MIVQKKFKHFIVCVIYLCFSYPISSQVSSSLSKPNSISTKGIEFFTGTWEDAKLKAKQENKPIFIDFYTSWCGPCKKMDKEIFTLDDVSKFYNENFVNYKINAEKGIGVVLAKRYKVTGFPTFYFVSHEEFPFLYSVGYMSADKFISSGEMAIKESTDPKPLALWQAEYEKEKNNKLFMEGYLQKLSKLKSNAAEVLDQYAITFSKEEIFQSPLFEKLNLFTEMNIDGPFYNLIFNNKQEVLDVFLNKYKMKVRLDDFLLLVAKNDVNRAIAKNDEDLLNHIVKTLNRSQSNEIPMNWHTGEIITKFYLETNDSVKLNHAVTEYANSLINYDVELIKKQDLESIKKFENDVATGKIKGFSDSLKYNSQIKLLSKKNQVSYAYRIRTLVSTVSKGVVDKPKLLNAEQWINKALQFSDNFTIYETKSILLYKIGKQNEGIECVQKAISVYNEMVQENKNLFSDKIMSRLETLLTNLKEGKSFNQLTLK